MKGLVLLGQYFWRGLPFIGKYLPFFSIFFLIGSTIWEFRGLGITEIAIKIGEKLVLADQTIITNMTNALYHPELYNLLSFFEIIAALFVFWTWFKLIRAGAKAFIPNVGDMFLTQVIIYGIVFGLIEIIYMLFAYQTIPYIPFYGLWLLVTHIDVFWLNVFDFSTKEVIGAINQTTILENVTNLTTMS
jgi:hypothetical protein